MYNLERIKFFKKIVIVAIIVLAVIIGFAVGNLGKETQVQKAKQPKLTQIKKENTLKIDTVKQFLIAYYTKKDLSENRTRYRPLMTKSMFQAETTQEDLPVNQAYKGYTINQVFDKATIYIDLEKLIAICEVNYHNTQLMEKDSTKGALINTPVTDTLLITFNKEGSRYLVNNIEHIFLSKVGGNTSNNNYPEEENSAEADTLAAGAINNSEATTATTNDGHVTED
jgi:hypothetical protein